MPADFDWNYTDYLLPPSVDWVAQNKVGYLKDQLTCGADWAFAATGAIEAAY